MRLSHKDFDALQNVILGLYEYRDSETFKQAVPDIFLKIIPSDHFSLVAYQINPAAGSAQMVEYWESHQRLPKDAELIEWVESLVWGHPFTRYFMEGGKMTALKFSDFFSTTQLRDSAIWECLCQSWNYDRMISLPVAGSAGTAAATLGRLRKDYTERDRMILNLLRPHFNQARRNAELATKNAAGQSRPLADFGLTPRETEIAQWVAQGKSNPEIAIIIGAKPRTIEKHMEKIFGKLGVENRTAAAVTFARCQSVDGRQNNHP